MEKTLCTVCNLEWGVSIFKENLNSYICPECRNRMKHNRKIKLGGKKDNERKLVRVLYSHF